MAFDEVLAEPGARGEAAVRAAMITIPSGQVTLSDRRTQRRWPVELAS